MAETDHRDSLDSIVVPTLVVCGDQDRVTPPKLSQELPKGSRDQPSHTLKARVTLANQEHPADFNDIVARFAKSLT